LALDSQSSRAWAVPKANTRPGVGGGCGGGRAGPKVPRVFVKVQGGLAGGEESSQKVAVAPAEFSKRT
jgi:hypothetical protein